MSEIKKIQFTNPPTPQHEAVLKEKEAEEREEKKPEVEEKKTEEAKELIEEALEIPQTPEQKLILNLWIAVGILAGILMFQYVITPISRAFKYTNENIENTDEIQILKEWTDEQTTKNKEERKTLLCSKITDQTKGCDKVKPLPTSTPTPTVPIIKYPTP